MRKAYALLNEAKYVARNPYAWPGGYPVVLVMADGGLLCSDCVRSEWHNIVQYTLWNQPASGWMPAGKTYIEAPEQNEFCDHCGKVIAESVA